MLPIAVPDDPSGTIEGRGRRLERELRLSRALELDFTLGPLRHGPRDPSVRFAGQRMWRATRTPEGPAVERITVNPALASVTAVAWGAGAAWLLDALPDLVGDNDDAASFHALVASRPGPVPPAGWEVVATLARRHPGLRIARTRAVVEALVPTIIEQRVTSIEAIRSYRELVAALGEPAPAGPATADPSLLVPPAPAVLAETPSWVMHPWGIERHRADTIRRAGAAARRLEETVHMTPSDAHRRLSALPGSGPWTAGHVRMLALGDPDAVPVGDFHFPNQVAWMLAGIPRGDDALMLELLEPWRGHRGRVIRLLMAGGVTAPKFGPRQPITSWRRF